MKTFYQNRWRTMLRSVVLLAALALVRVSVAGNVDLKISAIPKEESSDKDRAGNTAVATSEGFYKIALKNNSLINDTPALRAEYRVFFLIDDGKTNRRDAELKRESGAEDVPVIPGGEKFEFVTKAVKLRAKSLASGYYYTSGRRDTSRDELEGIWVRVLDGDEVVEEFVHPSSLKRDQKFD
ncbi:MAG: hypothetical protein WA771_14960 [Chthoniobacterales bacterium]